MTQTRMKQDVNKNKTRCKQEQNKTQTRTQITGQGQNTNLDKLQRKKRELDRIEPVSRVEALIPDDVILIRSGSLDTGYGVLDDATSKEGR